MSRTVDEPGYQADVQGNMIEQHERRLRELEERARVQANLDEQTLLRAMQAALPEYKAAFSENYGPHWAAMVTRVEALERRYSPAAQEQDHAWARKVDEKLEELESHRVFAVDREYDRQARWHATYNAVLPTLLQMCIQGCSDGSDEDEDPMGTARKEAIVCANDAHGPLEAKGPRPLMTPEELMRFGQVNELVKAAQEYWLAMGTVDAEAKNRTSVALLEALKPFEVTP